MAMPTSTRSETTQRAVRLTKREIEVLSLIAQGHSSKEAADTLYVSKRTVDFHLANIYDKLQVNNRVQAFRAATRMGLIPFEPTFGHARGES
jgi:DNA-binding NarL/FixJ family response regulator